MSTIMPDDGATQWIDKRSLAALPAIQEFERDCGYSITVFQDDHWDVAVVDGRPSVMLNRAGVFTLAMLSPDQDKARQFTSEFTSYLADLDKRKGEQ